MLLQSQPVDSRPRVSDEQPEHPTQRELRYALVTSNSSCSCLALALFVKPLRPGAECWADPAAAIEVLSLSVNGELVLPQHINTPYRAPVKTLRVSEDYCCFMAELCTDRQICQSLSLRARSMGPRGNLEYAVYCISADVRELVVRFRAVDFDGKPWSETTVLSITGCDFGLKP